MPTSPPRNPLRAPLSRTIAPASALALLFAAALPSQPRWIRGRAAGPDFTPSMVYDEARERVVMVIGPAQETWEWHGDAWSRRIPLQHPSARSGHALAYDAARRVVVLYGGVDSRGVGLTEHWEWDGRDWQQRTSSGYPPARIWHQMTYDAARGRVVLFGGQTSSGGPLRDTWEFDGVTWSQRLVTGAPAGGRSMVYDAARQRTVLCVAGDELWEWDGNAWTNAGTPPAASGAWLTYDSTNSRVVLFSGRGNSSQTWSWDGANWALLDIDGIPRRHSLAMAFDRRRGRVVLHCGRSSSDGGVGETWEFQGAWQLRAQQGVLTARRDAAAAYDRARNRIILFGGSRGVFLLGDTWEWDGAGWRGLSPATSPSARREHAMAYDEARQRVVLFGGRTSPLSAETWEWNGTTWLATTPSSSPAPRLGAAMAYDGPRQRVLLFGGHDGSQTRADTWHWDGSAWTQLAPTTSPPPRSGHAMAYDAQRQRVVLFGGNAGSLTDTWEWDGSAWTQRSPATRPTSPWLTMTYDEQRQRVVLVANGTWEWTGTDWTQTDTAMNGSYGTIVHDAARRRSVYGNEDDTWLYTAATEATATVFGSACAGTAGPPSITGDMPFLGSVGFGIDLVQANPTAPAVLGIATASQSLQLGGGCSLYLAGSLVTLPLATNQAGLARARLPVPLQNSLRGAVLFAQGFVADPQGAFAGLAVTQGLRLLVGD